MKNSADQGGCCLQRPKAEVNNSLRCLQNFSYPTIAEFNNNCFAAGCTFDVIVSILGQQQLVVVNYACGFNQSETGKYFK